MMKTTKGKILDREWYRLLNQISKYSDGTKADRNPELIIDHIHRTLSINDRGRRLKNKANTQRIAKRKLRELSKLEKKVHKARRNSYIKAYYLDRIRSTRHVVRNKLVASDTNLTEDERNKRTARNLAHIYPIPDDRYFEQFISEFIAFLKFAEKQDLFQVRSLDFFQELLDPAFYHIEGSDLSIDFSKELAQFQRYTEEIRKGETSFNAHQIKEILQKFDHAIGIDQYVRIRIRPRYLFSVDSRRRIFVPENADVKESRLYKTIFHEVMVHLYRSIMGIRNVNDKGNSLRMLRWGMKENFCIEEGLASYVEQNVFFRSSKHDIFSLSHFYLRLIVVRLALNDDPYTVFTKVDKLTKVLSKIDGGRPKQAEKMRDTVLLRAYRGFLHPSVGCVNPRIAQYLYGNRLIWEYLENGGNLVNLYAGKIGLKDIEPLRGMGFTIPDTLFGEKEFPFDALRELLKRSIESR